MHFTYPECTVNSLCTLKELKTKSGTMPDINQIQIERTPAQRRRMMEAYRKIMEKIIRDSKLKKEKEQEYKELGLQHIKYITTKSTLLDYYNKIIILLRGESVLTWYTPCDKAKDKEPWLDTRLTDKWMPQKTPVQKKLLKEERQKSEIKILGEDPMEREKRRKQLNQEKRMRVVRNVPVKVYTCNAKNATEEGETKIRHKDTRRRSNGK